MVRESVPGGSPRRAVGWSAAACAVSAATIGLLVAPPDQMQGDAARLMYLHVPAAWTAYLCYLLVLVASAQYLRTGHDSWHRRARVAAEIGVPLTALTIALGSIWGRAVWGVWWAWDPRLVSTALLGVIYCGYLALHHLGADERGRRRAAWCGIASAAVIPVVHFSVVWWRSLHQPATLLAPSANPPIDGMMAATLALAVVAFTLAATWLGSRRLAALDGQIRGTSAVASVAR